MRLATQGPTTWRDDGESPGILAALAEVRARLGADFAWFGRLAEVVPVRGGPAALWWSGLWADGDPGAGAALRQLDDRPVANAVGLSLATPPATWQHTLLGDGGRSFWQRPFARAVYLENALHEEHRLLVEQGDATLGLLAVAWHQRRVGATSRLSPMLRATCGATANSQIVEALHRGRQAPPPLGEVVVTAHGMQFASEQALQWLDDARLDRVLASAQRAARPDPLLGDRAEVTVVAAAGAELRLTPLRGLDGDAWLGQLCALRAPQRAPRQRLTPGQAVVVDLVLAGCTAPEIARHLSKSVETIRSHIKQAYARLGVANRLELAAALRSDPRA